MSPPSFARMPCFELNKIAASTWWGGSHIRSQREKQQVKGSGRRYHAVRIAHHLVTSIHTA